jgi:hypothetical protein
MIISDLSYLEVVSEAENLEGGCGSYNYYGWYGDYQSNSSSIGQSSGDSSTQQVGLVNVNASSNNVAVPVQLNLDNISL